MVTGVGIVGAGAIAHTHAAGYLSAGTRVRLTAVADLDHSRAHEVQKRFGFERAVVDYRDLLARPDVEVVSICTPAETHAQVARDAIVAGKHVLCEKPIATTLNDAAAIIETASQHPDVLASCVFQHRDDPGLLRARWILDRRLIGEVHAARITAHARRTASYYRNGRGRRRRDGGGALIDIGIHLLDALIWLLGDVGGVSATTRTAAHDIETEDTVAGWARMRSGVVATVDCSTCAQRDAYTIDILGERASLRLHFRPGWGRAWEAQVRSRRPREAWGIRRRARRNVPAPVRVRGSDVALLAMARATGSGRVPRHLRHGPHIRAFLDRVEQRAESPVPLTEAYRSLECVLAFYHSATTARVVELPMDMAGMA